MDVTHFNELYFIDETGNNTHERNDYTRYK